MLTHHERALLMSEQKMIVLQVDLSQDESKIQQYIDYHADVWPDVIEDLKRRTIVRMRIYNSGNRLIMLLEVDKDFTFTYSISNTTYTVNPTAAVTNEDYEIRKNEPNPVFFQEL